MPMLGGPGPAVDQLVLLLAGFCVLALAMLILRVAPRWGFVAWLLSICFVPYWLGVSVGPAIAPGTVIGVLVLVAVVPVALGRLSLGDWGVAFLVVAAVALYATGQATLASTFVLGSQWLVGCAIGRLVPGKVGLDWTYRSVSVAFTVVAVAAVIEFVVGANPFVTVGGSEWAELQVRGGNVRAEGAFGHSIALGACIAGAKIGRAYV